MFSRGVRLFSVGTPSAYRLTIVRRYTADHEWVEVIRPTAVRMGITDYAQKALGDLVYVELPKVGTAIKQKEPVGVVESVKGASDVYAPLSGTVTKINETAIAKPSLINKSPEGDGTLTNWRMMIVGWLCELEMPSTVEMDALYDKEGYEKFSLIENAMAHILPYYALTRARIGVPRDMAAALAKRLGSLAPVFTARPEQLSFLPSPTAFYEHLKTSIGNATRRVTLASLYLGTDEQEQQLVSLLDDKLKRESGLSTHIYMDYLRGTRGSPSSASLLMPLAAQHSNLLVSMYLAPAVQWRQVAPPRWNEIFGVSHLKVCVFDDNVLVTGANLSKNYFENRADRYICVTGHPKLANYFDQLIRVISGLSHTLNGKGGFNPPSTKQNDANLQLEEFLKKQAAFSDPIDENCTFLVPSLQMSPLGIRQDERLLDVMMKSTDEMHPHSKVSLATGYFNLSPMAKRIFAQCKRTPWHILTSSPEANGFFNSDGVSKYIPDTYRAIELEFLLDAAQRPPLATNDADQESIYEYSRPDWTFHAKGLWIDTPEMVSTVIGSSNFGHRSSERDLEAQLSVITSNSELMDKIRCDRDALYKYSKLVSAPQIKSQTTMAATLVSRHFKGYL
ncbi:CDP-diacylglycerol--glycerol-3-phosphate 3-phosphatidyltransferase [Paramicrosporidium saccamoebae]|uniref:CDP-diacylglycerol--glycerol-3-phosphate 3-phosphatidyltransferase n=1 Tax=Paramicrosporidium saccamoebae TaxID=1246581 RepID=A0A2H9TIJ7_9FUNG|nr:CDP-diacylglycerol--glycerol-3-phosphate 3-phosphatidyltransferase [Paramicrosporidium saccamoebae]